MTIAERIPQLAVGVIGTGRIGRMHASLLANRVRGARLAAVCDIDRGRAEQTAAALGSDVVSSPDDLIASGVDALVVSSSSDSHPQLIADAANGGLSVFCEKPLTLSLAEARALGELGERAGIVLQVGFNRRFDPAHAAIRAAVAEGALGDLHMIRISSRDPEPPPLAYARASGGLFLDMTSHDFDMARYVSGTEVEEVFVRGATRVDPTVVPSDDVDTAIAVLVHMDGCITTIDNSRGAPYGYDQRVEAFGSEAMVSSGNQLQNTTLRHSADGIHTAPLQPFYAERYEASYVRELEAFVDAVAHGRESPVTARDAEAALAIGLAATRSLRQRRPVRITDVYEEAGARR